MNLSIRLSTGFLKRYFDGEEMRNVTPVLEVVSVYKKGDLFWQLTDGEEKAAPTDCLLAGNLQAMAMNLPVKSRIIVFEYSLTSWKIRNGKKTTDKAGTKLVIRNCEPFEGNSLPCSALSFLLELKRNTHERHIETQTDSTFITRFPPLFNKPEAHCHKTLCNQSNFLIKRLIDYFTLYFKTPGAKCSYPAPIPSTVSKLLGLNVKRVERAVKAFKGQDSSEMPLPKCENILTSKEKDEMVTSKAYTAWLQSKGKHKDSEEPCSSRYGMDSKLGEEYEEDGGDDDANVDIEGISESSNTPAIVQNQKEVDKKISLLEYDNKQLKINLKKKIKTIADKDQEIAMLKHQLGKFTGVPFEIPTSTNVRGRGRRANGINNMKTDPMEKRQKMESP